MKRKEKRQLCSDILRVNKRINKRVKERRPRLTDKSDVALFVYVSMYRETGGRVGAEAGGGKSAT